MQHGLLFIWLHSTFYSNVKILYNQKFNGFDMYFVLESERIRKLNVLKILSQNYSGYSDSRIWN